MGNKYKKPPLKCNFKSFFTSIESYFLTNYDITLLKRKTKKKLDLAREEARDFFFVHDQCEISIPFPSV